MCMLSRMTSRTMALVRWLQKFEGLRMENVWTTVLKRIKAYLPFLIITVALSLNQNTVIMMTSSNGNIFRVTGPLIHRSPVNSTHKGQWRRALILPLIFVWTNGWVTNRDAGDLRRYRAHYHVTEIFCGKRYAIGYLHSLWVACKLNVNNCCSVSEVSNREADDLRRYRAHYDVIVMILLLYVS